jgi:hypothetical protein
VIPGGLARNERKRSPVRSCLMFGFPLVCMWFSNCVKRVPFGMCPGAFATPVSLVGLKVGKLEHLLLFFFFLSVRAFALVNVARYGSSSNSRAQPT